jgi:hypothetical protein
LLLALWTASTWAAPSEEELFFKNIDEVNEGELRFLDKTPQGKLHHHRNHITLAADSLASGWVRLEQCHEHLDAVPSSQIVYSEDRIRSLRIIRSEHIERAWVEGHSVQMRNIQRDAVVCIEAESRALLKDTAEAYILRNGPYMRRFLDGYYPMRVTMTVSLGDSGLRFDSLAPAEQPGFSVRIGQDEVGYDTWFEGRLITAIRFVPRDRADTRMPPALQTPQPE